jgi:hypothetical protein
MSTHPPRSEYLVLSRDQWGKDASREKIQAAIDRFHAWYDRLVSEGRIGPWERLAREGKTVSRQATVDRPFAEAREVVSGYWFILADSVTMPLASPRKIPA